MLYLIPFLMHVASEAEPKTQTSGSAAGVQIREALGEASLLSALPDVVTKGIPGCRPRKEGSGHFPELWVSRRPAPGAGLLRTNETFAFPPKAAHAPRCSRCDGAPEAELALTLEILSYVRFGVSKKPSAHW